MIVFDPLLDPEWNCDFITADQSQFLDVFWRSRSCMAFIDEGGESVGRYNKLMNKCVTRGRHWGHTVHIIAQEATQIGPLVRAQCTKLFAFAQSKAAGELLAREWLHEELEQSSTLKKREYMYAVKMGSISIHRRESNGTNIDNRRSGVDVRGDSHRDGNDQGSAGEDSQALGDHSPEDEGEGDSPA